VLSAVILMFTVQVPSFSKQILLLIYFTTKSSGL